MVALDAGDLGRFRLLAASFPAPAPWPQGRWLSETPERLWLELVAQLLVVGGRRPVERMWENGEMELLALPAVLALLRSGADRAAWRVHEVLARNGVRYASTGAASPSPKARQVVAAARSPALVRDGAFHLRELLLPLLPGPPEWGGGSRAREREARSLLVRTVEGFGMKSASDFLNHLGASLNLLAFDSRIQALLRDGFGLPEEEQRRLVGHPRRYEGLERPFVEEVCPELGLPPAVVDELMFANSEAGRRLLRTANP